MNLDPYFTPYTKINLKWVNDLNIKAKAIKLLKENIRVNLNDLTINSYKWYQKHNQWKKKIKWYCSHLVSFEKWESVNPPTLFFFLNIVLTIQGSLWLMWIWISAFPFLQKGHWNFNKDFIYWLGRLLGLFCLLNLYLVFQFTDTHECLSIYLRCISFLEPS